MRWGGVLITARRAFGVSATPVPGDGIATVTAVVDGDTIDVLDRAGATNGFG